MNMKIVLLFLILCNSLTQADDKKNIEAEAAEKWSKIMSLVNNEIKTIKSNQYSGPELKHRIFELYSEKIKLIKEKENVLMLKANPKSIASRGKDFYFKSSREQYMTAQKYALKLIKEYPAYPKINEIFYALAVNSRDYGTNLETEKFLKYSIKYSQKDSKTMYNAKTALAEFYYNSKRYKEAISYYDDVLKTNNNEWYGKHLYNASWCYLKEHNEKKALELIKESFSTTKDNKYVSMKEQINNAIGIFYVQADATREGIQFYQTNTNPSAPWLLMLASSSMNKNNFPITEEVLRAALADTQNRKDIAMEMKVRLAQLNIYRESKNDELFFETSNRIHALNKTNKLDPEDLSLSINKIKDVAGFMQINLVKDKLQEEVKFNINDYKKIMRYFDILASLDKKNKNQYRYYQGETALSTQDYQVALKYYVRAVVSSKLIKDKSDINKKSLEAMLSFIEAAKLSKEKENEYTIFTFKNFVLIYPQSDKSQVIYQKLFNKYFELHKNKKAINVLLVYKHNYPGDVKIHREMLTQILDSYIKEKNTDKLAYWISKINKGYLSFSAEYIQNSIAILGGLLFDKYKAMEKLGNFKEAMNGYESIYDSKQYPARTRAEAAYAIAALYLEHNKSKSSFKWLNKSLDIYENKDLIKITPSILVLAKGYRLLQNFEVSSELATLISKRFCDVEFVGKDGFYELLLNNGLIQELKSSPLIKIEETNKNCKLEKRFFAKSVINNFEHLILNDKPSEVTAYYKAHLDDEKVVSHMSQYLQFKFWLASDDTSDSIDSREKIKKEILDLSTQTPSLKLNDMITQYDKVLEFRVKIRNLKFVFSVTNKFDEDKYNSEIEQFFSIITELSNEAIALSKNSNPEEVLLIREVLPTPYNLLSKAVTSFNPQGVDANYLLGFKKGMRQITESLSAKVLQLDHEKRAFLDKNNFFLETQKHVKFEMSKEAGDTDLSFHSAILFSNTLDINRGKRK